jgi:hypothetical protein
MAKQKGPIKYEGTIGDIRHFRIKGLKGYYAGMKGGPTANQIKNAPEFERTRESMNEFGGSAKAAKSLRNGLAQAMKGISDPHVTGRLTAIMKRINLEDQSEARGYRAILISEQSQYLKSFNFNKNVSLNNVLNAPISAIMDMPGEVLITVPALEPKSQVVAPSGATHFRIIHAATILSDFEYNSTTKTYEPIKPDVNELSVIKYSDYESLTEPFESLETTLEIMGDDENVRTVVCVGIEFFQKVNTDYLRLNGNASLRIIDILKDI